MNLVNEIQIYYLQKNKNHNMMRKKKMLSYSIVNKEY